MAQQYDVIAATGCPTGIAHTFMAKEALEKAAAERGLTRLESKTSLPPQRSPALVPSWSLPIRTFRQSVLPVSPR